jgi:hypothetical protein
MDKANITHYICSGNVYRGKRILNPERCLFSEKETEDVEIIRDYDCGRKKYGIHCKQLLEYNPSKQDLIRVKTSLKDTIILLDETTPTLKDKIKVDYTESDKSIYYRSGKDIKTGKSTLMVWMEDKKGVTYNVSHSIKKKIDTIIPKHQYSNIHDDCQTIFNKSEASLVDINSYLIMDKKFRDQKPEDALKKMIKTKKIHNIKEKASPFGWTAYWIAMITSWTSVPYIIPLIGFSTALSLFYTPLLKTKRGDEDIKDKVTTLEKILNK